MCIVNRFDVIGFESYRIRWNNEKITITPFKVIQRHPFW